MAPAEFLVTVWHPANPVGQPLPSTLFESDAVGPLPIASKLPAGMPISKYFQLRTPEDLEPNVRYTADWQDVQSDPVFAEIAADGEVRTVAELIALRTQSASRVEGPTEYEEEGEVHGDTIEQASYGDGTSLHYEIGTAGYGESITSAGSWASPPARPPIESEEAKAAREQEERLAALGVSGFAKPVRAPARPYIAGPEPPRQFQGSDGSQATSHSASPADDVR